MKKFACLAVSAIALGVEAQAQEYIDAGQQFVGSGQQFVTSDQEYFGAGSGQEFIGAGSVGSSEPLFSYDDQERWKHGYLKEMPYYEGYHAFRPYNYHHVFSQSRTAAGWGMPAVMPYSQQFWHRYEHMTNLSGQQYSATGMPMMQQPSFVRRGVPFNSYPQAQPLMTMPANPVMQQQMPVYVPAPPPQLPIPVTPVQYEPAVEGTGGGWGAKPTQMLTAPAPMQQYLLDGPTLP
jgi:hypothetical protein